MLTPRALSGADNYAAEYLSVGPGDYYSEHENVEGQWLGRGAELLGLEGEVDLKDFDAIRQGLDPKTGEFLRPRVSADRHNADGELTSTGRTLYDFTMSAPKSVSIMALADPRLLTAHDEAVLVTAREMERLAAARVRQGGLNEDRTTGNLVMALYRHDTSRELDPQIHTHIATGNLTYDGAEGRWKALQASEIYQQRKYLTEVYRNDLAKRVQALGHAIVDRFTEKGEERGFEIAGVSQETIDKFSQRSAARDKAIAEFTRDNGRPPTDGEIAVLVRENRPDKSTEVTAAQVTARQWNRMTADESAGLRKLAGIAHQRGPIERRIDPAAALEYSAAHLFERASIAKQHELMTEALRQGRGGVELDGLKTTMTRAEHSGRLIRAGNDLTTTESLNRERAMIQAIDSGVGRYKRLGSSNDFTPADWLTDEQKHGVRFALDSTDFATNIAGAAGVGKTTLQKEIQRGLTEAGRDFMAVGPTRSSVEELQAVGFRNAVTVELLLQNPDEQQRLNGKVLIVDEAGMISNRQMSDLIKIAQHARARILFTGDTKQISSVEAGDALRILEQESKLRTVSVTKVQRQTVKEYREAVETLRTDPAEAFKKFEAMGAIHEVRWQDRPAAVATAYREASQQRTMKGTTPQVLAVAPTHEDIFRLTHAIRQDRIRSGELGESSTLTRHVPLNWTKAEKQNAKLFAEQPGLVLEFHKKTRDVKKNEALTVLRVDDNRIITRKSSGIEVAITRRHADAFSVHKPESIEVAAGDKLLLQANRKDSLRATNGELVTVSSVEGSAIHLTDGRTLPDNYRQFAHGYVVTAHRSQAKTVDRAIVSADAMDRSLFYVAATRSREQLTIITSDKEQLRESIGASSERASAVELAKRAELSTRAQPDHTGLVIDQAIAARERIAQIPQVQPTVERLQAFQIPQNKIQEIFDTHHGYHI